MGFRAVAVIGDVWFGWLGEDVSVWKSSRDHGRAVRAVDVAAGGAVSEVDGVIGWSRDLLGKARAAGLLSMRMVDGATVIEYASEDAVRVFAPMWSADVAFKRWEKHRVIYRVDPTLTEELALSDDQAAFPSEVLRRVPHPDPCLAFVSPLATVHPSGSRLEYTLAFITGCVSTSEGLMVCGVHDPAATGCA